jgi:SAM-dependent methyltransferase
MWKQEAVWIGNNIEALNFSEHNISCLNIGSSTKFYRESLKPYIFKYVIQPIERRGVITHLDAKPGVGVDICGDLADPLFRSKVTGKKYELILCNNVLTHVPDPDHVYEIILKCLADDGFVILSAPNQYPYCADPFDSKYRPKRADIESKLPTLQVIQFMRFESSETLLSRLIANKKLLLAFIFNIIVPRRGLTVWKNVVADLFNLNRRFVTIGLVMHRQSRPVRHRESDDCR